MENLKGYTWVVSIENLKGYTWVVSMENLKRYTWGNPEADHILVQMVGDHELPGIKTEAEAIREYTGMDFYFIAFKVDKWNRDLSPWNAPAVFGEDDFGNGADDTLERLLRELEPLDRNREYYIGGYSLSGLFALWSVYQTDVFSGVAAASPSMWFPGFIPYMKEHELLTDTVYLSLGDREDRTRNPVMSTVGDCIRDAADIISSAGANCILEWNRGNHFREPDLRMAKAFVWILQNNKHS